MTVTPAFPLSLRSYGADGALHRHAHVQIVLPMQGQMEIEVGGRGNRLDLGRAAFVAPDVAHVQSAQGVNRFLILDCQRGEIGEAALERLQRQTFVAVNQPLRRLIEFIDLRCQGDVLPDVVAHHCAPLLLDALLLSVPDHGQAPHNGRLAGLLTRMEVAPQLHWSTADMAQCMHLSVSRLHALFRAELQQTPQEWLSAMRMRRVQQALIASDLPLADLALDSGYANQSTLTRAMRRATGMTPAAYRRQQRS